MLWWWCSAAFAALPSDLLVEVGVEVGAVQDAFVSPGTYQGTALSLGGHIETRTDERIDDLWGYYLRGEQQRLGSVQALYGGGGGWTIQPRLMEQGEVAVYLGGAWDNRVRYRQGRAESYTAWSTLGPAATIRWRPVARLRLDGGVSIPIIGVSARPAYTVVTIDGLPETISVDVTSVHNLQSIQGTLSADWQGPSGASVRLLWRGGWQRLTTTDELRAAESTLSAALVWRWR
ncbi:MAG: hypothetical protein AAFV53_00095 [Myxococcota bacterium]